LIPTREWYNEADSDRALKGGRTQPMADLESITEGTPEEPSGQPEPDGAMGQTDQELVRRILSSNDPRAVDCLYRRHGRAVEKAVAGGLVHPSLAEVEDLAQEVWIAALDPRRLSQWRGGTPSLLPWLRSIARNKVKDYYRSVREIVLEFPEERDAAGADPHNEALDPEWEALRRIAMSRLLEAVFRCAASLSDAEYLSFMTWLDAGSLTDLAAEIGKTPNTIHQDAHRAKKKVFRQLLRHYRHLLPEETADSEPREEWTRP